MGEDHGFALGRQRPHLVLEGGDVFEHQRAVGSAQHRKVHQVSSSKRERSSAGALWVRAPTDTKSTPVAAMALTVSRVTPPLASSSARPSTSATAWRSSAGVMLSRRIHGA